MPLTQGRRAMNNVVEIEIEIEIGIKTAIESAGIIVFYDCDSDFDCDDLNPKRFP